MKDVRVREQQRVQNERHSAKAHTKCDERDERCLVNQSWQALGRVRAFPPCMLQLTFACLGLVPDRYSSLPHFATPPVSRATESLFSRAVAGCRSRIACILETCEKEMFMEKFF